MERGEWKRSRGNGNRKNCGKICTESAFGHAGYGIPNWVRPFKDSLNGEMSLETYYCLETLKSLGVVTMTELAQHLKVPKQQVTKLVDNLYKYQFVERAHVEDDRRRISIRLTAKAVDYLDEYYLKNTAFIRMLEEKLTEEELLSLNDAILTLKQILPELK